MNRVVARYPNEKAMDTTDLNRMNRHRIADFPALEALGFTDRDLILLACQGFLSVERRGARTYFKLRYRRGGQQQVKYVRSANRAAVQDQLETLQWLVRTRRELAELARRKADAAQFESRATTAA